MRMVERLRRFFSWEDTETDEEYLDNVTANMTELGLSLDKTRLERYKMEKEKEPYQ